MAAPTISRPTLVLPVKPTLSTPWWAASARPGDLAGAVEDVHDSGRQPRLRGELGEAQDRQRRLLGRLDDDGVPARRGRGELPGRHEQRVVPRDDRGAHAHGLTDCVDVEVRLGHGHDPAAELRGPARVVAEPRRGSRHVLASALATVLPLSTDSSSASSTACSSTSSARRHRTDPRASGDRSVHGPACAARAEATARSTSAGPAACTRASRAAVAGSLDSISAPGSASAYCPSIHRPFGPGREEPVGRVGDRGERAGFVHRCLPVE